MISVSESAKAAIRGRVSAAPERRWYLAIFWEKGDADSFRAADGSVLWNRLPDKGWRVQLMDYGPEVAEDLGEPLLPGVRLAVAQTVVNPPPSGTIDIENETLVFRANAA